MIPLLRDYVVVPGMSHSISSPLARREHQGIHMHDGDALHDTVTDCSRMGQLPRLPPRILNTPSIPRPELQFRRRTRFPSVPRLSTPRCILRIHRYLLTWDLIETGPSTILRLMAR